MYLEIIIGLIILIAIILDIAAVYYIVKEDLFYTKIMKLKKVLFVLIIPYIGAMYEIKEVSKFIFVTRGDDDTLDNNNDTSLY